MQREVTCSISDLARWGLTRLKEKRQYHTPNDRTINQALGNTVEFMDSCIEHEHPYVPKRLLNRLYEIDPRLELHWELQHYFEHRWHIKFRDVDASGSPDLKSIIILQFPWAVQVHEQAAFLPFNSDALYHTARLMWQIRNGGQKEIVDGIAEKEEKREEKMHADRKDMADALDREQRLIQERLSGKRNISDPGWERGIGFDETGKPFIDGKGAHTKEHTKAF